MPKSLEDQYLDEWLDTVHELHEEFERELADEDEPLAGYTAWRDYYTAQ